MKESSKIKLIVLVSSFAIFIVAVYALYMDDNSIYRTPLLALSFAALLLIAGVQSYRKIKNKR